MLESDRDTHEIVQQLSAVQAAVRNASRQLVVASAQEYLLAGDEEDTRITAQFARDLIELIERAP